MSIPTVVSVGAVASGTNAITPGAPAGTQAGDILILIVETANQNLPTNPPTNWNAAPSPPVGFGTAGAAGGVKLHVFWRRLTAAYTAVSIGDSGDHQVARIICIRGCATSGDPWNATATSNQTTANTTISWDSITTTVDDCLIIGCVGGDRDASSTTDVGNPSNAALANITTRMENWVLSGQGGGIFMFTGGKATAGSIGTTTASITSQVYCKWIGALAPAAALLEYDPTDVATSDDTLSAALGKDLSDAASLSDVPSAAFGKIAADAATSVEISSINISKTLDTDATGVIDFISFELVAPDIIYHYAKGFPLTHAELDANLTFLNNTKLERNPLDLTSSNILTVILPTSLVFVNSLAEAALVNIPSGTPQDGRKLLLVITDNGSRQALSWNAVWRGVGVTLPVETLATVLYVASIYNEQDSKWDVVART